MPFWLKHFMLSILNFVLKTHPPGPMLIATKSWPGATWPRVIELWGGASTPCFPVHTGGKGSTSLRARSLWWGASGGRAPTMSFGTCGYRNSCRVKPLHSRVTERGLVIFGEVLGRNNPARSRLIMNLRDTPNVNRRMWSISDLTRVAGCVKENTNKNNVHP